MVSKPKLSSHRTDKKNGPSMKGRNVAPIKSIHISVMCFLTYCLSSITLETGARSPFWNRVTRSDVFNNLFRRNPKLIIKILGTNIITGLITTVMMVLGEKYDIPYLYLPWLVNTITGMVLYEGPALLSLTYGLLRNITISAGLFTLITFLLYVEELCIWNDMLTSFYGCWLNYYNRKKCAFATSKEKLCPVYEKKQPYQETVKDFKLVMQETDLGKKLKRNQTSVDSITRSVNSSSTMNEQEEIVRKRFQDLSG